jgi:hypothetical protein
LGDGRLDEGAVPSTFHSRLIPIQLGDELQFRCIYCNTRGPDSLSYMYYSGIVRVMYNLFVYFVIIRQIKLIIIDLIKWCIKLNEHGSKIR